MKTFHWLCAAALAIAALGSAAAQEQSSGTMSPPKILTITREFVKPGKTGPSTTKAKPPSFRRWRVRNGQRTILE